MDMGNKNRVQDGKYKIATQANNNSSNSLKFNPGLVKKDSKWVIESIKNNKE